MSVMPQWLLDRCEQPEEIENVWWLSSDLTENCQVGRALDTFWNGNEARAYKGAGRWQGDYGAGSSLGLLLACRIVLMICNSDLLNKGPSFSKAQWSLPEAIHRSIVRTLARQ